MKKSLTLIGLAAACSLAGVNAQIVYNTANSTYSQNFNTLTDSDLTAASVGNSSMLEVSSLSGGGSGNTGWYIYGIGTNTRWGRSSGSSSTGSFYGMRDGSGNLALGSQGSGSNNGFFGAVFQNTTGGTLDSITITFDAVINRNPATTVNPYNFSYLISSSSVNATTGATGAGTFNNGAGTWTSNSSLSFTTPSSGTGAPGTQAAINPMFTIGTYTATLSGTWNNNDYLYIRWSETDNSGADATAGIDNFSLQAIPEPTTWALLAGSLTALVVFRRRRHVI
ncbi:MAG: hypothetical protein Fur0032_17940 [Terrimicrobiaceae bacterium]